MSPLDEALRGLPDPVFGDLLESDEAYLLVLDLPGATAESIDASVAGGMLQLEVQRRKDVDPAFDYVREDRSVFLDVEVPLPPDATGAGGEGRVHRGVLELELPKRSATAGAAIPIEEA
ncbi:Hsp20/alpha crystallin family protein [Halobacteriales archaeon Cl-PHB]